MCSPPPDKHKEIWLTDVCLEGEDIKRLKKNLPRLNIFVLLASHLNKYNYMGLISSLYFGSQSKHTLTVHTYCKWKHSWSLGSYSSYPWVWQKTHKDYGSLTFLMTYTKQGVHGGGSCLFWLIRKSIHFQKYIPKYFYFSSLLPLNTHQWIHWGQRCYLSVGDKHSATQQRSQTALMFTQHSVLAPQVRRTCLYSCSDN